MGKKKNFDIKDINFDATTQKGTCKLVNNKCNEKLSMIWSIETYPTFLPSMPGAPYPLKLNLTIYDSECKPVNSMSGTIIYEINSGTLPAYSNLGVPFSCYKFVATNNKYGDISDVSLDLNENYLEVRIKN
jgi:hypothetical protein